MSTDNSFFKVVDNFMPEGVYFNMKSTIMGRWFPWYFAEIVDYECEEERQDLRKFQFTSSFYRDMAWSCAEPVIYPIVEKIKPVSLIKAKANLQTRAETSFVNSFHIDEPKFRNQDHVTAIYYFNSCDGKTVFESGEEIESIGNRIVFFQPNRRHSGTSVTNAKSRCVVNINFIQDPANRWVPPVLW